MDKTLSHKTVFVQNIPSSCSNDQLKEVFSVIGPIKECFVVKPKLEKDTERKKFIGFVTYHSADDTKSAVNSPANTFVIDGVKTKVVFAKKKKYSKKGKAPISSNTTQKTGTDIGFEIVTSEEKVEKSDKEKAAKATGTKKGDVSGITVLIAGFSKSSTISDFVRLWKIKMLDLPEQLTLPQESDIEDEHFIAHAVMTNKQSALKTVSRLNGITFEGNTVKATLVLDKYSKEFRKLSKRSRLIIRNLSFACTEEDLKNTFERFGNLTDVNIPTKEDGKMYGYGFVQFSHVFEATKAIKEINMTAIKGRKVAVDWALSREKYKEINNEIKSIIEVKDGDNEEESVDKCDGSYSEGHANEDGDSGDDVDEPKESDEDSWSQSDEDSQKDMDDLQQMEVNESDGSSEDTDDESHITEKSVKDVCKKSQTKQSDYSSDVHEGKTVFIRNVSFDTEEEDLGEVVQKFGEYKYCKIVQNPATGLSKGCAFVQFLSKDDADNCIKHMNADEAVMLHNRQLYAIIAQSRSDVRKIVKEKKESKNEKEDTRYLHLANEGLVRPGTQSAIGLSEIELNKRQKVENAKRQKLKNPDVFVSTTRLCIHNLPRSVDDAALKKLFLEAAGGSKEVKITEARVMRNREKVNASGVGRALGFAFVNFTKHEHALKALRELNNNPETFSQTKRPIVEFSLENKQALEVQAQRRKRQIAKSNLQKKINETNQTSQDENPIKSKRQKRMERKKLGKGNADQTNHKAKKEGLLKATEDNTSQQQRKEYQGSVGITAGGKKLKMPKHIGPKIRSRNKGQILEQLKASKKLNKARVQGGNFNKKSEIKAAVKANPVQAEDGQKKSSRKRGLSAELREDKEFNNLVEKYTKQFQSNFATGIKRPKWFDK